jgi:hypothetical protein
LDVTASVNNAQEYFMKKKKQKSDDIREIKQLLPAVLDKLFPVPVEKLKWDKAILLEDTEEIEGCRHISLYHQSCPIREEDFIKHFLREIISERVEEDNTLGWRSELYVELKERESTHVKSFCLIALGDKNENDIKTIEDKLLPKLDNYKIHYLLHRLPNGHDSLSELRLWIFCDTSIWLLTLFINNIIGESDIKTFHGICTSVDSRPETMPIPGGYCLRNDTAGSVEFRGTTSKSPIFAMKSIIDCQPISEMQMLAIVGQSAENKRLTNG